MKTRMTVLMAMLVATTIQVHAQQDREAFKAAMEACSTETGVTRPEPGVRPSEEDRAKMSACLEGKGFNRPEGGPRGQRSPMDETTKAAFEECAATNGITLGQGNRPSEEERAKMDACLEAKGFTRPSPGGRGAGRVLAQ